MSIWEHNKSIWGELQEIKKQLVEIKGLILKETKMTQEDFAAVTAAITAETTVEQSAITLLNQLTALIKANANDPTLLAQVLAQIDVGKSSLAAAVTANTPAAPTPTV